jgi:hypothetical protein
VKRTEAVTERERPEPRLTQARLCFGILFAVVAGITASVPFTMPLGDLTRSKPGFWVFWVGAITTILIAFVLLRPNLLLDSVDAIDRHELGNVALAAPVLLASVPLLMLFGVVLTTVFITFYWFKVVTHSTWLTSAMGAAGVTAGIVLVFISLLDVPFPVGSLTRF